MSSDKPASPDLGASARRGVVSITFAKMWFMVAGLVLQLALPRRFALGAPEVFGVYTLVLGWISSINNVLITGTIQGIAHFSARGPAHVERAKAAALRLALLMGGPVALGFFLLAPVIAAFEHDPELTPLLRLSAGVALCYSFYAVFVGAANGARRFHVQAGLDISFSTLRAALILGAAMLFHTPLAAICGFVIAAALITVVSALVVGRPRPTAEAEVVPVRALVGFIAWLIVYLGATNVLMFLDGWWLKRLCTEAFAAMPDGKRAADALVGIYGAAQTVARLPYQLILAGAFVVFPLMSAAALDGDRARTAGYIRTTLRFSLIVTCGLVLCLGGRPGATMRLLYPPAYTTGGGALSILLCGYLFFSLFSIVGTILNGLSRIRVTALIGVCTVLGTMLSVYLCVRVGLARGEQPLRFAALGMTLGVFVGLCAALIYLYVLFRVTFPLRTLGSVALGVGVTLGLLRFWPAAGGAGLLGSKVGTLISSSLTAVIYGAVLLLTGELSPRELLAARRQRPA